VSRPRPGREQGSVSVLAIVVVVLAGALAFGVARTGRAAGTQARAETAADAAALAAAGALVRGGDPVGAAASSAADNGARLLACDCAGARAVVTVRLAQARARARAEVRYECVVAGARC
jgi:hypothetical protein